MQNWAQGDKCKGITFSKLSKEANPFAQTVSEKMQLELYILWLSEISDLFWFLKINYKGFFYFPSSYY